VRRSRLRIVSRPLDRRWPIALAFGLVHGFGFAGALGVLELERSELATALFSFNLGVELGQAAIVALAFPVLARLRRRPAFDATGLPVGSAMVGCAGLVWLVWRIPWCSEPGAMSVIHPPCVNHPVRRRRLATAVLAAALATPAGALAAHPLVSDDAGTLGRGAAQLELAAEVGRDRRASPDGAEREDARQTAATLTLGVRTDLDVVLGVASTWSRVRVNGAVVSSESGVADLAVQAKWRVLEVGGSSLAAKPRLTIPHHGRGAGRGSYSVALIASQVLGPVALDLNGGYARNGLALACCRRCSWSETSAPGPAPSARPPRGPLSRSPASSAPSPIASPWTSA
jgi:hypothetical protein